AVTRLLPCCPSRESIQLSPLAPAASLHPCKYTLQNKVGQKSNPIDPLLPLSLSLSVLERIVDEPLAGVPCLLLPVWERGAIQLFRLDLRDRQRIHLAAL